MGVSQNLGGSDAAGRAQLGAGGDGPPRLIALPSWPGWTGVEIVRTGISSPPETSHADKRSSCDQRDGLYTATGNIIPVRKTRNLDPRSDGRPLMGRSWPKIGASPAAVRRHLAQARPRISNTPHGPLVGIRCVRALGGRSPTSVFGP